MAMMMIVDEAGNIDYYDGVGDGR